MQTSQKPGGKLVMASNSLGLPVDIPSRSLEVVRSADLLVFEEDRGGRPVLKAAGIHRSYLRFNEHNQTETLNEIRDALRAGKTVAYLSDQGCPGLADPGKSVVAVAVAEGAEVTSIPGPSSLTAAIAVCPFDLSRFHFAGFTARDSDERIRQLRILAETGDAVVLLDTPYRMPQLLSACQEVWGPDHRGTLALDISGPAEKNITAPLASLGKVASECGKLNFVLIVEGGLARRRPASPASPAAPAKKTTGTPYTTKARSSGKLPVAGRGRSRRR